ncbi:hypothetical protein MBLNU457_1667t1 [Dothideomycetes sp. NU457]
MASWAAEDDRRLFLAILVGSDIATPKWDNIKMAGRTKESMRQRFQKLRKMVADEAGDDNGAPPQTPAPPKRGRGRPKRKAEDDDAEKAVKREKVAADDDDEDEDTAEKLELARPTRTRATRGNSAKTAIKTEDEAETGADAAAENEADESVDLSWLDSEFEYPSSDPLPAE